MNPDRWELVDWTELHEGDTIRGNAEPGEYGAKTKAVRLPGRDGLWANDKSDEMGHQRVSYPGWKWWRKLPKPTPGFIFPETLREGFNALKAEEETTTTEPTPWTPTVGATVPPDTEPPHGHALYTDRDGDLIGYQKDQWRRRRHNHPDTVTSGLLWQAITAHAPITCIWTPQDTA